MERHGFIHEKLDIKIFILFILRHLPDYISFEKLSDYVLVDDGFDYFEYTQCLAELVDTGLIIQKDNGYKATRKGARHAQTVESSLPYTVRTKAEKALAPLVEKMKRDALIGTSHKPLPKGGCKVELSLSDGIGEIISLSILTADEAQAIGMEKNFRENAETLYHSMIGLLSAPEGQKP